MRRGPEPINWRWDPPVAGLLTVVAVAGAVGAPSEEAVIDVPSLRTAGLALLVAASLSLVVRRRHPTVVAVSGALCAGTYFLMVNDNIAAAIPAAVGLYTLSSQGYRIRAVAIITGCTTVALITAVVLSGDPEPSIQRTLGRTGWMAAVMIAGEVVRYQSQLLSQARARAVEAELTREEAAGRRAAEERVRIARELHDSLTHSISVINVQSSVALHVLPQRPAEAEEAVRHIRSAGQDAMRELRSTLQTLRISDTDANPSLSGIADLVRRMGDVGMTVTLAGEEVALSGEADVAAYRIVQEALTNAVRHSGAKRVRVDLIPGASSLTIVVGDDGVGADEVTEGHGLTGMRERVTALGGSLKLNRSSIGGFEVRAELPMSPVEPSGGEAHRDQDPVGR
ncbi:sensor histidine kinase [Stackebrandtia endophytica]|nr:sensor histidine kinase [Stackebrandtia endophytica]